MKLYLAAAAGGVVLAMAAVLWIQGNRLDAANEARGELAEQVTVCAAENEEAQRIITGLEDSLDAVVREREAQADAAEQARREARETRERIEGELSDAQERLQALYEGDCRAWADMPVCPAVARELRD